ncbi:YbbR-like domain-containing protein [Winogradskyella wichelsiae]|uniref:cellulose binding domain-containing protein n=1 Tax=Winogradskyella wichelsiae TaxID=2697007 RepID=UPI0015C71A44|nr:cellulose binding domain-containing protein [Winogradskyella wichelsiae]
MSSKKKTTILDYIKKKSFQRFSLFFIVAFVFLIFSKLSNDYKQTIKLNVRFSDLDDEILIKKDTTNYIQAYVETKGFSLMPFMFDNSVELTINARTDVTQTSKYFIFDVFKHKYLIERQLGNSFDVISLIPDTLLIPYAKRASKIVPIKFQNDINYSVGYDLKGKFILATDSVKVVGSQIEVSEINAIVTEKLVLKDVKTNIENTVVLDISNFKDVEVFPKSVDVTGRVARFTEGVIEVPITVVNQPNNVSINYFPKTVTLSYYVDLDQYNTIKTSDFKVECDYSEIEDHQTFLIPKVVKSSEFVKHVKIKQKQIDFIEL